MSIDWHSIDRVEMDLVNTTVTLKTKEGYPIAQSKYASHEEALRSASKAVQLMQKAKKDYNENRK